jgi:Na+/H+-dicarboxylate symporter
VSRPDAASATPGTRRRWHFSLTTQIVVGLACGVALGLFFGERMRVVQPLADAYVRLMQMTVLPYLSIGLVLGFGRLDPHQARQLAKYGLLGLLALWGLALLVVSLMPLAFPRYEASFFFSTALLEQHEPPSFVDLYIPANPFHSLANSVVPAATLFSAALGLALMAVPGRERILGPFDAFMQAIARLTGFIVRLTPLGVIPIAAVAAGTLSPAEFSRLEVYFVTFIAGAVVLGLVLLPLLVTACTPFGYREVVGACRDALLTAFVTSSVFVVLPMIVERSEELARRHGIAPPGGTPAGEIVVPIAFNFPTAGKLLTLLFVPFAAWLAGVRLDGGEYPGLLAAGVFSYFAKAQVALPFLLDLVEVPQDLFQLYIPTTLLNGKFDSMVGAMSLFAFSLITATALSGGLRLERRRLLRFATGSTLTLAGTVLAARLLLGAIVDTRDTRAEALARLHAVTQGPPMVVLDVPPPPVAPDASVDPLQRILERGSLRVGFIEDRVPFSFRNAQGELVGYDVELAARMAGDLGLRLELVEVTVGNLAQRLEAGQVDVVPGLRYAHHWLRRLRLSDPYMGGTIGLLVEDWRRDEFRTLEDIRAHDRLVFGVLGERELGEDFVRAFAGETPFEIVVLDSITGALKRRDPPLDAVVVLAESGMAWSLMHPQLGVVIPRPGLIRRPIGFGMAPAAGRLGDYVDEWVRLQEARGDLARAYDFWVLGKGTEERRPRWSVARDVLGWPM